MSKWSRAIAKKLEFFAAFGKCIAIGRLCSEPVNQRFHELLRTV